MKRNIVGSWFQLAVAIGLIASATIARGDTHHTHHTHDTHHAHETRPTLELGLGTGYTRGLGSASGEMPDLRHLAGDGGALKLEAALRIDPRWALGCFYEGSLLDGGHVQGSDRTTGAAAGVEGRFRAKPHAALDPWIGLGFGWRGIWLDHGSGTHGLQGLDLARLQVGLDYRVSPRLTVAPTIGATVTELLWEKRPGASDYASVGDRSISTFVFAGLSGRMDVWSHP